ncbi:DUF21 domain-containing protein [Candidatus Latescibacterota bacterium]
MTILTWLGICFCISQSAMFSGLNLAVFSISKLRLEVEASTGNKNAIKVLHLRQNANYVLTTILWGNVGINVLLTLLSNSILSGVGAFLFSTVLITFLGEIIPQAYFSRHALSMASLLSPVLRFYQLLLYPVAKPISILLDKWLGKEGVLFFREKDLREVLKKHIEADESDLGKVEGIGAVNFMDIDDTIVINEGEPIDPESIISIDFNGDSPVIPDFIRSPSDSFLKSVHSSGKKWVIFTDRLGDPHYAVDADGFIRNALFEKDLFNPLQFCHKPIVVKDESVPLRKVISQFTVTSENPGDDVVDKDVILIWSKNKRVITGSDILGRLLRGISKIES